MTERDRIIIVGAGHNGLVCAAYLAKAGRDVLVLEAADRVGGAAVTREFAPGYRVSACAHLLYLLDAGVHARARPRRARPQARARRASRPSRWRRDGEHLVLDGGELESGALGTRTRRRSPGITQRMLRFARVLARQHNRRPPRVARRRTHATSFGAARCSASTSAGSDATTCASSCASPASTSSTCSRRRSTSALLKGALAFDAVLGTNLGPRSNNSVLALLHRLSGMRSTASRGAGAAGRRHGRGDRCARRGSDGAWREDPHVEPGSAHHARRRRVAGVELATARRSRPAPSISNADPTRTLLALLGARHLETGFAQRVAPHPHARHGGQAASRARRPAGSSTASPRYLAGERLVIAPDLDYVEHAFDHVQVRRVLAGAGAGDHHPERARRARSRPAGTHVLSAVVQYAPYDAAREHGCGARRVPGAHARRSSSAMRRRSARQIVASELLLPVRHRARVPHHRRPLAPRRAGARPVPDAAAGTGRGAVRDAGGRAVSVRRRLPPGGGVMGSAGRQRGARRPRSGARGMRHGMRTQGALSARRSTRRRSTRARRPLNTLNEWHRWKDYTTRTPTSTRRSSTRRSAMPARCSTCTPMTKHRITGPGRAGVPEPPRHPRRRQDQARQGRLLRLVRRQRPGHRRRHDLPPARRRLSPVLAGAPARLADALGARLRRLDRRGHRTRSPRSRCRDRRAARCSRRMGCNGVEKLPPFGIAYFPFAGTELMVSRTGFTGDLGYELWIDPDHARARCGTRCSRPGADHGIRPMGTHRARSRAHRGGLHPGGRRFPPGRPGRAARPFALAVRARPRPAGRLQEAGCSTAGGRCSRSRSAARATGFVRLDIEGNKPAKSSYIYDRNKQRRRHRDVGRVVAVREGEHRARLARDAVGSAGR